MPPCYIDPGAQVGESSLLGPHTVLEEGSTVGRRVLVQRSALLDVAAEKRTTLYGVIFYPDAIARVGVVLNEGAPLADRAEAGKNMILLERVAMWPGRQVPAEARLTASLTAGGLKLSLAFRGDGTPEGAIGAELTAKTLLALGGLLGRGGTVSLDWADGAGARMLAQAAGSGAATARGRALPHDTPCLFTAVWLAESWGLPVSLLVQQKGERAWLYFFNHRSMPLGRARGRQLEGALLHNELRRMPAGWVGRQESVIGARPAYAADAAKRSQVTQAPPRRLEVMVPSREPANRALAEALERLDHTVRREAPPGIPAFRIGRGGSRLSAEDEGREPPPSEQLSITMTLIEYEGGAGRIAVPDAVPAVVDTLAAGCCSDAFRLDQDEPEAKVRYEELPWLRDAPFVICRICAHLDMTGEWFHGPAGKTPRFVLRRQEVSLRSGQGEALSVLPCTLPGTQPTGNDLRIRQGEGWIILVPLARSAVLRIVEEARGTELAEELCTFCAHRAEEAGWGLSRK